MKVVIFCGGLGVRMGEATQRIPKPMITVGDRPILWHIMKWYASLGAHGLRPLPRLQGRGDQGVLPGLQRGVVERLRPLERRRARSSCSARDISDWRITFVDTGTHSTIAERLMAVAPHLGDDEYFLATYGDGLTDAPLDGHDRAARRVGQDRALHLRASRCSTRTSSTPTPTASCGRSRTSQEADVWINGGFLVFRREILDYINPGEELVIEPFARLIEEAS